MSTEPIIIHDLQSAAERAKVTPQVILRWISEGLKATPVGTVGKRGPRDYRIFDSWLVAFIASRAVRYEPKGKDADKEGGTEGGRKPKARKVQGRPSSTPVPADGGLPPLKELKRQPK